MDIVIIFLPHQELYV
jgi:hypothetical protein